MNKTDLVSPEEIHKVHGMIRALNPSAEIHDAINSEIAIGDVLGTGKFNQDLAAEEGWLESLLEQAPGQNMALEILYTRDASHFHHNGLTTFNISGGVIRSKGYFGWLPD